MRFVFSRWILLILWLALIFSFPFGVAYAESKGIGLGGIDPTPYLGPVINTEVENAHWLILGAAIIVIIIFAGVLLHRQKS